MVANALAVSPMIFLAAAALATTTAPTPTHSAAIISQATATIRIVAAVKLKLDEPNNDGAPPSHDSEIRLPDGSTGHAKLIEFQ
jgi:hypothetical protein